MAILFLLRRRSLGRIPLGWFARFGGRTLRNMRQGQLLCGYWEISWVNRRYAPTSGLIVYMPVCRVNRGCALYQRNGNNLPIILQFLPRLSFFVFSLIPRSYRRCKTLSNLDSGPDSERSGNEVLSTLNDSQVVLNRLRYSREISNW